MDEKKLLQKIYKDFNCGNFKENFKDLIKIYKKKKDSDTANKLGTVLAKLNKKKFAKYFFEISIKLDDGNYKPYYNLANLYKSIDSKYAEECIDKSLKIFRNKESILIKAYLLIERFEYPAAEKYLKEIKGDDSNYLLGLCNIALNNFEKARIYFDKSLNENIQINFLNLLTFPRIYNNTREIFFFRKKFKKIIAKIETQLDKIRLKKDESINILKSSSNFYLSYQQKKDLILNKNYFRVLKKIDYRKNNTYDKKIFSKNKIVFISSFFYKHTVLKLFFNFVKELSFNKDIDLHLLHISGKNDNWTNELKNMNLTYNNITEIDQIHNFLIKKKFGSAIFLDHSMDNISQSIINYKYARKYFILWGHPVTTGSKTMDYFISSQSMDKDNDEDYSEKLLLIKSIGINYKLDEDLINIENQNILENSFYVNQSLFKLLPKYDYLYGRILEENKKSTITFIKDKDPYNTKIFIDRLKRNRSIKNNFNRILFLDRMKPVDFYKELAKFKIVLDSIGWSGGNTSIESIYLDKPIVTLKGNNLRSNHTAAILYEMNLNELIAKNYTEYIEISNKLMSDENFFRDIVAKIKKNKKVVFESKISFYNTIKDYL